MSYKKKTWLEKLEDREGYPQAPRPKEASHHRGSQKMVQEPVEVAVLENPSEVIRLMRLVPYGKVTTIPHICQVIADQQEADASGTLTSGISVLAAAKTSVEAAQMDDLVPYWRTLKADGYLNADYPGGCVGHERLLLNEGHTVIGKGMTARVDDLENRLFRF